MSVTKKIGGNTFTIEPLGFMATVRLQAKIAPALAEAMGAVGAISAAGGLDADALKVIDPAVSGFFKTMGADDLDAVTRELLHGARMDGVLLFSDQGDSIEVKMQGRTLDYWKLMAFAVEVNYPDFFALFGKLAPKAALASEGSNTLQASGPAGV